MATYTMREVTAKTELPASALRYYEKEQLIPQIHRDGAGNRRYSETDLEWISFIKTLRHTDMPIQQIKQYVSLFQEGPNTLSERKALIEKHTQNVQREIEEKQNSLQCLEKKVRYYETLDRRKQRLSKRAFRV